MVMAKQVVRPNSNTGARQSFNERDLVPDPLQAVVNYTRTYVREYPENAALWCLGIGFVLGWKLKPW